jgi:hypothetical protein
MAIYRTHSHPVPSKEREKIEGEVKLPADLSAMGIILHLYRNSAGKKRTKLIFFHSRDGRICVGFFKDILFCLEGATAV